MITISLITTYTEYVDKTWGMVIIDHARGGTHLKHNVVYNSDCKGNSFKTHREAKEYQKQIVEDYIESLK